MYRIAWKSKITDKTGRGKAIFNSYETCKEICKGLNKKHKNINHYPEKE
jgi:hypothetical protein